ncbi:hypothetical protein [Cronobacter sakazakii]|uniref:hypothetical protein n=1 Tax=Cronobacter sakazakii TaxID=28141 RepID=UPI00351524DB
MNKRHHEVVSRMLLTRELSQFTGSEALEFSDECWAEGIRLAPSPFVHYQMVMDIIRRVQNRLPCAATLARFTAKRAGNTAGLNFLLLRYRQLQVTDRYLPAGQQEELFP